MLTRPTLPLSLVPRCLDVLYKLSSDERDLIRVVVEIVQDLREPGDEEDDLAAANQSQDSIVSTVHSYIFISRRSRRIPMALQTRALAPSKPQRSLPESEKICPQRSKPV